MPTPTKYFLSAFLLLLLSGKLLALTFNTVGCGEVKGCFASPVSCSSSDNCDFLVTYNATNSSKVEFELSGRGDWVAVGFSNDQSMENTDILMCVSNSAQDGHYYATGQTTPNMTSPTPSAFTITYRADENGVIKCRISRDISPNPAISNFRDLNQDVFLLAAVGTIQGSTLVQHSKREASPIKVNITQANSTVTTTVPEYKEMLMSKNTKEYVTMCDYKESCTMYNAPTNSSAPLQQGSFRSPDSCQTSADCNFLVTYQSSGDNVVFEISGKGSWAGVGFSDDRLMPDTDMLICVSDQEQSGHYYATGRSKPTKTNPTPSAVEITEHSFTGGVVKCKISREKNPEIDNFRDLNKEWFLLGATGPLNGAGDSIEIHTLTLASESRINVMQGGEAAGTEPKPLENAEVLVHGILMTLAWILFAFVGLFTARYMREVWEPKELMGKKAWFTVHRTLMTTTLLLTIAATILIFAHKKGWSSNAGPHPYCGIVAIAFALVQPIMATFRPHPGAPRRNIFNWSHRIVGTIALVMAVVSIYFGLDEVDLGKRGLHAVICFYIGEFLIFLFELYLILSKRNKEKRSVSMSNTGDIQMQQPGHQTPPQPEMSIKEAMIRTLMFVFVVLLGASIALTIILLLVFKHMELQ